MAPLKIPVGISDFKKLREDGYYYIDKSGLIADLLTNNSEVTLITRPRRFGKTLAMSMLANFFDIRKESFYRTSNRISSRSMPGMDESISDALSDL